MRKLGGMIVQALVVFTVLTFGVISAHAVMIDFEGVAGPGEQLGVGQNYSEDGFNLFNPGLDVFAAIIGQPTQNTSGSDYYTWNSPASNNPITMTNIAGLAFDLASLDVGSKTLGTDATFSITGYFASGGSEVENVTAGEFASLDLNWLGLNYVEFAYVSGNFGAIDNLNVHPVPEPTTLLLVGAGLISLAGARRKMKT